MRGGPRGGGDRGWRAGGGAPEEQDGGDKSCKIIKCRTLELRNRETPSRI